jgi:hypothetical protein
MRRLYFLVPDVESAAKIVDELLLARVEERHIHIVAKDHVSLEEANLPEATVLQESDFVPAVERGLAVGGVTGMVAGVAAVTFPPAGLVFGGGAILATSVAGAGVGAWLSGMIGVSAPNSRLRAFEDAIEAGQLLMILDVPRGRVDEIDQLVRQHHPEAEVEGMEPTVPPFP